MVLKGANRSQNTGNTLRKRGFRGTHAVIIKNTTISAAVENYDDKGLILATPHKMVDDGNLQSNIQHRGFTRGVPRLIESTPYSLNKKARWNLPGLIQEELNGKSFAMNSRSRCIGYDEYYKDYDDSYEVTLMEHAKINMSSKTTAVYSTKNPNFTPRSEDEPMYYEKSLGSIKEARSDERKRVRGNSKKAAYFNGKSWLNQTMKQAPAKDKKAARKINQASRCRGQQRPLLQAQNELEVEETPTSKSEVEYHVYHPIPRTSGLAYSSKHRHFVDGMLTETADGQASKSKKRSGNRGRQDANDLWGAVYDYEDAADDCFEEYLEWSMEDEEDVEEMINEAMEDESEEDLDAVEEAMIAEAIEQSIIAQLIEKAEETELMCKSMQKVAGFGLVNVNDTLLQDLPCLDNRIDATSSNEDVAFPVLSNTSTKERKVFTERPSKHKNNTMNQQRLDNPAHNPLHSRWFLPTPKPILMSMKLEEVLPPALESQYGAKYMEANVCPRIFTLDVSDELREELGMCKATKKEVPSYDIETYLVGEVMGCNGDGLVNISISLTGIFNNLNVLAIDTLNPCEVFTLSKLIEQAVKTLHTVPSSSFKALEEKPKVYPNRGKLNTQLQTLDMVASAIGASSQVKLPCEMIRELSQQYKDGHYQNTAISEPHNAVTDITCNVCFMELPSAVDTQGVLCALALKSCQHWFCKECWKNHLATQVHRGVFTIKCPEYECDSPVDPCTLLSLVGAKLYRIHRRLVEQTLLQELDGFWCPNAKCGRLLSVTTKDPAVPVECACGHVVCSECQKDSHWPLSCQDAKTQIERMKDNGDIQDPMLLDDRLVVHVKPCPNCQRKMEKQGGCPYMSCICGRAFCWGCGKDYANNKHNYCYEKRGDRQGTKAVVVRHIEHNTPLPTKLYDTAVYHHHARGPRALRRYRDQANKLMTGMMKCETKILEECGLLPFTLPDNPHVVSPLRQTSLLTTHKQQYLQRFVYSGINMLIQIHYLLEYSTTLLETLHRRYKRKHLPAHTQNMVTLMYKMEFTASQIHGILEGEVEGKDIPRRLAFHCYGGQSSVRELVKMLKQRKGRQ